MTPPATEVIRPPWQNMLRGARLRPDRILDIMFDIDEVLCPTIDSIHQIAFEKGIHDGSRPMETWRGFEQYDIPEQDYWDLWSEFALSGGYTNTEPIPGAIEALRRVYWEGHRIHLVTARGFLAHSEDIRRWTPEWLTEFAVPYHTLVFTSDKVASQVDIGVRFDYAVDDSPKNFEALLADGVEAYLHHHPHNATYDTVRRVNTLDDFVEIVLQEAAA